MTLHLIVFRIHAEFGRRPSIITVWKASSKPIRMAASIGKWLHLGPLTEDFSILLLLEASPVALDWIYQIDMVFQRPVLPDLVLSLLLTKACVFSTSADRKSRLVVRTHRLSAHILEEIHLCWLQLLWVPALVGGRAWIPPLPPSLILVSLQKPTWSAIFSSLAMQCAHSISPDVSRSHSYHWWGCHCHQLKLQGRAVKSNCCWIVS